MIRLGTDRNTRIIVLNSRLTADRRGKNVSNRPTVQPSIPVECGFAMFTARYTNASLDILLFPHRRHRHRARRIYAKCIVFHFNTSRSH